MVTGWKGRLGGLGVLAGCRDLVWRFCGHRVSLGVGPLTVSEVAQKWPEMQCIVMGLERSKKERD